MEVHYQGTSGDSLIVVARNVDDWRETEALYSNTTTQVGYGFESRCQQGFFLAEFKMMSTCFFLLENILDFKMGEISMSLVGLKSKNIWPKIK